MKKNNEYKGIILRHETGRGWEFDGSYYDTIAEAQAAIDGAN